MNCEPTSRRTIQRWLFVVMTTSALVASGIDRSDAQCVELSDRASQLELDTFVKSPSSLLERLRNDKDKLKYRLSALIATNPAVLPSVKTLVAEASSTDRSSIGAGLRLAETRCTPTQPDAARKIRDFAQRIGDLSVQAGYAAAGEDRSAPSGAQAPSLSRTPAQPSRGDALLDGPGKTKLADPFKPIPIPQ